MGEELKLNIAELSQEELKGLRHMINKHLLVNHIQEKAGGLLEMSIYSLENLIAGAHNDPAASLAMEAFGYRTAATALRAVGEDSAAEILLTIREAMLSSYGNKEDFVAIAIEAIRDYELSLMEWEDED